MPTQRGNRSGAERQVAYEKRRKAARDEELRGKGLPPLPLISTMPGTRRWKGMLNLAHALIQSVCDERGTYFDDCSKAWQESARGETFQDRSEAIAHVLEVLDENRAE